MNLTLDQWMNICGVSGVILYLFAYWMLMRGWARREDLSNRFLRLLGLTLLLIPLYFRWYLEGSLIMLIGFIIATVSGGYILIKRRDTA